MAESDQFRLAFRRENEAREQLGTELAKAEAREATLLAYKLWADAEIARLTTQLDLALADMTAAQDRLARVQEEAAADEALWFALCDWHEEIRTVLDQLKAREDDDIPDAYRRGLQHARLMITSALTTVPRKVALRP